VKYQKLKTHSDSWRKLLFLAFFLFFSQSIFANTEIGLIEELSGTAFAKIPAEDRRQLSTGDQIYQNDTITTEAKSSITLKLKDDSLFELGEDAKLLASKFIYKQNVEEDSVSVKILKGTFRFVTGLIAKKKPRAMEVETSVATIGIRGTHVVGEASATSATIILMEPEDTARKTAIVVSNNYGTVTVDEPGYGTEVPDEFSPPSPPRRMRLQTINNLMRSIQSSQRINLPRPRF
jgi:FecR-like protein